MSQRALAGRTATVLAVVAFAWLLAWFIQHTFDIFLLLLISVILATGLAPLVSLVERWRLPRGIRLSRGVAIGVVYLALLAALAGIFSVIIVPAVSQATAFVQHLPEFLDRLRGWLLDLHRHLPWVPDLASVLANLPAQIAGLSRYGPQAAEAAFRVFGGIATTVAVLVFAFYMLLQGAQVKATFLALFPPDQRPRAGHILERIAVKFGGWLRAQLLLSSIVAASVAIGLLLIGMPFPALLGIVAGLGELIPMVGPSLGAAVAILVALSQPLWRLIAVAIFYVILMNVEPHILVPRIMSRAVGMSPLLTLFALLTGIKLLGIVGGLLAVPIAAALQVIASEIAQEIQPDAPSPPPGPEIAVGARPSKRR